LFLLHVTVLRSFLDEPQIYLTQPFRNRYEARARQNIHRLLQNLALKPGRSAVCKRQAMRSLGPSSGGTPQASLPPGIDRQFANKKSLAKFSRLMNQRDLIGQSTY
jgi:hypothetical protein